MNPSIHLRPATPDDATWAVPLIQATIGGIGHALTGTSSDQAAVAALVPFFRAGGNRLCFEQTLVAELDGVPAGVGVSYPGDLAEQLDGPFRSRLRQLSLPDHVVTEAMPDEWYLDTLATLTGFQGRGVARMLVAAVAAQARAANWPRLGLLVEPENRRALSLYHHLGFQELGRRSILGAAYLHLTRPL